MSIDEIYKDNKISLRSYHICKQNNLKTIKDLKNYFFKHKSFDKLRNCGRRSNEELIEICKIYQSANFESDEFKAENENPLKTIILELTRVQREVINSFILINTNSLSNRSKNAVLFYLKEKFNIRNFSEIMFSNSLENWKNIGPKSIPEIETYIDIIEDFVIQVSQSNDEKQLISLKNNFLIQRAFSIAKIPNKILETESIFLLTDFLLNQNALFNETHTAIVKNVFKIYQNQKELTLDNIAEEVNLSRERVRQIRQICLIKLFDKLLFIQNFNDDLFQKYNIDINSDQIDIDSDIVNIINSTNKTNLSREFITYIVYTYLYDSFSLVGNIEDVFFLKKINARNARNASKRHSWSNFYLIKKEIVDEIDFEALTKDIDIRISDRIEESYSFNFKSYLSSFLTNNNIEILNLVFPIAEKILDGEFNLYLDLDDNLIFSRNTIKQLPEYVVDALENFGEPVKLSKIYNWIEKKYPDLTKSEEALRGSIQRSHQVIYFGRSSTYGLKKWEYSKANIKGGTIRQIAAEYLSQFTTPKHISDISNHVLKYRPKSNQYSILQNLKLDESGLYVFFKDSNIGLSSEKYEDNFISIAKDRPVNVKSWEERFEILKSFTEREKRLPLSSGVPEKEIKLNRWINVQNSKIYKGSLGINKELLMNNLLEKFSRISRGRKEITNEKYEELIRFVSNNHRLPNASENDEENLYQFFDKQMKLFDKKQLKAKEEKQFIEVAKLLQNIKYENKGN